YFFFTSGRRHTSFSRDWSSDVCSSDLVVLFRRLRDAHLEDFPEPRAFVLILDAGGKCDTLAVGHVDQIAGGNGDSRGKARALAAERKSGVEGERGGMG